MTRRLMDLAEDDVHIPRGIGAVGYKTMKKTAKPGTKPKTAAKKRAPTRRKLSVTIKHPQHGSISVRNMREVHVRGVELDVATALADTPAKRVWIQIAKSGAFAGHAAGPFELNDQVFGEIIRNFKATQNRAIPVDFEHASEADATSGSIPFHGAPAHGWIYDLKVEGPNMFGLTEWGSKAREYIEGGHYKFLSPAVRFGCRDRVTGKPVGARLTSVALTNIPFLDGMQQVAAKHGDGDESSAPPVFAYSADEYMPKIKEAIGMPALCRVDDVRDQLATLSDLAEQSGGRDVQGVPVATLIGNLRTALTIPMTATMEDMFSTLGEMLDAAESSDDADDEDEDDDELNGEVSSPLEQETATMSDDKAVALKDGEIVTLKESVKTLSEKLSTAEGEVRTLREEKIKRDEIDEKRDVDAAFDTYKDARNLSDVDREVMAITRKSNPDVFARQYPPVAAGKRHLLRAVAGGGQRSEMSPTDGVTIPAGQTLRQDAVVVLADRYQRENPTASRAQALNYGVVEARKLQASQR